MARKNKPAGAAPDPGAVGGFRGFGSQALPFLAALAERNEREWFNLNKATYLDECDAPMRELVQAIGLGLAARNIALAPMARNPVFRIYRDVRFARDKSPYKTHLGAALHPEGDKSRPGLLYLHIEPGKSFVAAGFYQPEPPLLRAYRTAVAADPAGFERLVLELVTHGLALDDGEPLARMPKGFEAHADSPVAAALRKRSWTTSRPIPDEDLERHDLPDVAIDFAAAALPLLDYFRGRTEAG